MNNSFNNKILKQIQKDDIHPKPRWQFLFKETVLWVGTILSLLLASLAAGSFIFQSANSAIVPPSIYFWFSLIRVVVIILFVILAIYQVMRIGRGYKRTKQMYLIISFIIIGIIGSLFFGTRVTGRIERGIGSQGIVDQAQHYWSDPESTGLLAGELVEISQDGFIIFDALDGGTHIVDSQFINQEDQNLFIEFLRVKMVGYEDNGVFYPCTVAPWEVRLGGPERHSEYQNVRDGNLRFTKDLLKNSSFNEFIERKDEIVRTNQCR